jgi:hypothetical protein
VTITYNTATLNARLAAVTTNIDAGSSNGAMRLLSPTNVTIALITLAKPSGTSSGGVLTFSGLPLTTTVSQSGQIVSADLEDSNGNVVASGLTVGVSTAFDIFINTANVTAGGLLALNFATITGR